MARFNLYQPPDVESAENSIQKINENMKKTSFCKHMVLDAITLSNLKITGEEYSLLSVLDHCCSRFGKR